MRLKKKYTKVDLRYVAGLAIYLSPVISGTVVTRTARDAPLVLGYSADGYWILDAQVPAAATASGRALYLFSGYVLTAGARTALERTNPGLTPSGTPDGTFVQDWSYLPNRKRASIEAALQVEGSYEGLSVADLDAGLADYVILDPLNGMRTDEFEIPGAPSSTYVYVITPDWPEVPRRFARQPDVSFRQNIIPLDSEHASGPPGRHSLYEACDNEVDFVHQWPGRAPY